MTPHRFSIFLRFGFLVSSLGLTGSASAAPALVVVISIDQFRGDYLERFHRHFGPDGFNLLLERGANFVDCHYRHAHTKTAPGHAVILSGVHADVNGIIANDWIDRETFAWTSCVEDPSAAIVGLPPRTGPLLPGMGNPQKGRSPRNFLAVTVGDELKLNRGGRPKVIGISRKDRSAILMAGKTADAAYFMDGARMVTSTYYMNELPEWVRAWNAEEKVDAYFGRVWERFLPESAYAIQGPDDMPGEDTTAGRLGNTLPKKVTGGDAKPGPQFYSAFENTPFGNEVLEDFAEAAVLNEQLGRHPGVTDLLCLSFSANDSIGHLYGPDSHEVMDNVVRMDRTLAKFFAFLDKHVELKNCLIVLTADHGAAPMPERVKAASPHLVAGRIDSKVLQATGEAALNRAFGPLADGGNWLVRDDSWFLLHPAALKEKKVDAAAAQAVVRDALLTLDFVATAFTRAQLEKGEVQDELGRATLLSFNRARSGDVYFIAKPYFVSRKTGTNHGLPYNYDTHVPLLWFGAGVRPGVRVERVGVDDIAPTLARLLGLPAPPQSRGRVLF